MKVNELVKKLQEHDQSAIVLFPEGEGSIWEVGNVMAYNQKTENGTEKGVLLKP